jgi:hypothetical protein
MGYCPWRGSKMGLEKDACGLGLKRPYGTRERWAAAPPAMTCWAIFSGPYGTEEETRQMRSKADRDMNCRAIPGNSYGTAGGAGRMYLSGIPFGATKRASQLQYRYVRKLHIVR